MNAQNLTDRFKGRGGRRLTSLLEPAVLVTLSLAAGMAASAEPPVAADGFPNGCVSCHVVLGEGMDKRLGIVLGVIGHRPIKDKVKQVPTDCLQCHESLDDPSFSSLIHVAHFDKAESNVFVQRFGGDCRHCHVMDGSTGTVTLKTGERNW
jgi:hypothetical protein